MSKPKKAQPDGNRIQDEHEHPGTALRYRSNRNRFSVAVLLVLASILGWVTYQNATAPIQLEPDHQDRATAPARMALEEPIQAMPAPPPDTAPTDESEAAPQADQDKPGSPAAVAQHPNDSVLLERATAMAPADEGAPDFSRSDTPIQRQPLPASEPPVAPVQANASDGENLTLHPARPLPGSAQHRRASRKSKSLASHPTPAPLPISAPHRLTPKSKNLPLRSAHPAPADAPHRLASGKPARAMPESAQRQLASARKSVPLSPRRTRNSSIAANPVPEIDSDVALLTVLVAHTEGRAIDKSMAKPSREAAQRQQGATMRSLLRHCKQLGATEGRLCRSRICSERLVSDATCQ